MPSVAWLLVAWLLRLLVLQNAELDLAPFACERGLLQQFYDVAGFLFGSALGPDAFSACGRDFDHRLLQRCGAGAGGVVLELGFGGGLLARLLVEAGVQHYDGLELSEAMLNMTAHHVGLGAGKRIFLHHSSDPLGSLEDVRGLLRSDYSHFFATGVLDSFAAPDLRSALEAVRVRLRAGGRACLTALADLPDRLPVKLYKAIWRAVPMLLGGRRPLSIDSFVDHDLWSVVDGWLEEDGWLPMTVLVLEKRAHLGDELGRAEAAGAEKASALQRWARHIEGGLPLESSGIEEVRVALRAATERLPLGAAKDVVLAWLPELPEISLRTMLDEDIGRMTKDDIIATLQETLRAVPSVQLQQEMKLWIKETKTEWLEEWMAPPTDLMSVEDLRTHINLALDAAMQAARGDAEFLSELLKHQEQVGRLQSKDELLELNKVLEKEVVVPPSEMSRDELEHAALEHAESLSREELEDELLAQYDGQTLAELQLQMREEVAGASRAELQDRLLGALNFAQLSSLLPAVREAASLVTDEELGLLSGRAAQQVQGGDDRPDDQRDAARPSEPLPAGRRTSQPGADEL